MGKKIGGSIASFMVDGVALEGTAEGDVEHSLSDTTKENIKPGFYTEKQVAPYIKGTLLFTENMPIETLKTADNMTVNVVLGTGRTVVLTEAWVEGEFVAKTDGKIEIEFRGKKIMVS